MNCSPLVINAATYLMLSIFCIPFLILYGFHEPQVGFWGYATVVGLLGAIGNSCLVKALQEGELSTLGPLNSYKSIFGLIFAFLLLKEFPSTLGLVGVLLIIGGSYFIVDTKDESFESAFWHNKSIQYRLLALFFCALEAVYIKKIIQLSTIWDSFVVWCFFGSIFSILILILLKTNIQKEYNLIKNRNLSVIIKVVICIGMMQFTTNYIFQHMNIAYALSIFQLSSIVSIFLGYKIFNEKEIFKKLLGATIMLIGAILIIMYN